MRFTSSALVSTLLGGIFTLLATQTHADIINGRYSVNQVFDVQRSPAYPVANQPFSLSGFARPFSTNNGQYDIGTGYIRFFYTNDNANLVGINLYDSGNNLVSNIAGLGSVYGLTVDGFFYEDDSGFGTFVSNAEGFNYGDSLTYTPTGVLASLSDLQAYDATTTPLQAGQVRGSGSGGSLVTAVSGLNPTFGSAARALDSFVATSSDSALATAFSGLAPDAARAEAVQQSLPSLAGATNSAVLGALQTMSKIVQARSAGNSGVATGDDAISDGNVWVKPFGSWSRQGASNGLSGFSTNTRGLVAGIDALPQDDLRLGMAIAYADTNVKGSDSRHRVDVRGMNAIAYGSYDLGKATEANFEAGLGINSNDSSRRIQVGGLDRTATGDYTSWSVNAGAGVGHVLKMTDAIQFIPSARLDYMRLHNNSYTEDGAGALNLGVNRQTSNQLIPAVDAKFQYAPHPKLAVSVHAGVGYDVLDEDAVVTSNFAGGGGAFQAQGITNSPWVTRSGIGADYKIDDRIDLSLRYDREDRTKFDNQTVSLKATLKF
ncbi:MAG: autotransporter outer membrane beta-barrel domain-containing protein [Alphaproteobacteria bacterium]|nr:MAG: autotransporter outer membrane beta-barrel domain-containing protein [Alphaproteobacteria bacterium]